MTTWITSFLLTKFGRNAAIVGLTLVGVAFVLLKVFSAGRASKAAEQKAKEAEILKTVVKKDAEIRDLPADIVRDRLREWAVDNGDE